MSKTPTPRDVRWLVEGLAKSERRLAALENRKPSLAHSSIEDGAIREFDKDGVQGSQIGKQPDGTHGSVVLNGPKPPKPTPAIVAANPGQGEARWNGKFVGDAVSPLDLKHVAAYFVLAGEFLDLSKQAGVMTGELGDNVQAQLVPGVYSVYLVAWSKAGRFSDASEPAHLLVSAAPDVDAIQGALDDLNERGDGFLELAGNLGNRLDGAEEDLAAHEGRLGTAEQRVTDAFVQIGTADGKATAAASAAATAQSKADTAAQAAADAAGIANGKGKVLVQSTAPGAADRNTVTLWIDTTGGANTPKRWTTGTTWVAVTDKAATDAAAAAAQAAQAAATAQSTAGSAQTTANNALTMAGTKGKVFYSESAPSGTGTAEGDLWRRVDTSKNVIGEWYWSGSAWQSSQITTSAIANLDVGKLTVGTGVIADLVAQKIAASTAAFQTVDVKNLFVTTGTMTEAVINKLWADVVMSRKMTVEMMAVGAFDNSIPEPDFSNKGESWDLASLGSIVPNGSSTGGPVLRIASTTAHNTVNSKVSLEVNGGEYYRLTMRVKSTVNAPAGSLWVFVRAANRSSGVETYPYVSNGTAIPANTWTEVNGIIQIPTTTARIRFAVSVRNTLGAANVDFELVSATRANAGELIVEGSLKAKHADLEDFAANTGFIADLTARIVKSEMFVGKEFFGGKFIGSYFWTDAAEAVGLKLDNQGLRVYGAEGGEPVTEIRADGGTVYSITDPATGDTLASLDRNGGVSGQELNIAGDPVFLGSPLLGDTVNFQHPSEFETPGLLDVLPRGMIARGFRNIADRTSVTNQEMEILEYNYVHEPGRGYRITVAPFAAYVGGGNAYGYLNVYVTTDGTRPSMSSTPTFRQYVRNQASGAELATFGGVFYNTGYQPAPKVVRIMITISSEGGTLSFHPNALASTVRTWVEDMGLSAPDTSIDRNGRMDLSVPTPVPPPEPPPVPKENYTQVWKATGYRSFDGNGRYTYADGKNRIYQGTAGYSGMLRSMVTFGNGSKGQTIVQALSGAKINSVKVKMRFDNWWYDAGGTAQIMLHGQSGLTSTLPSMTLAATSSKWPKPGTRTVSIPSSRWEGFKTGDWKGVGLGAGSSGLTYYGYARGSAVELEIKYTK